MFSASSAENLNDVTDPDSNVNNYAASSTYRTVLARAPARTTNKAHVSGLLHVRFLTKQ
jgi:hypothetical protein